MSKVKFKIITFITAILLFFGFTLSPIHVPTLKVKADTYLTPYEELKQSEGFDEASLFFKTDITVIDLMEYWEDEKQEYPALFVYVYNPTDKIIKDSTDNCIRLNTVDSKHLNSYKLDYVKSTDDNKYVKYVIENSKEVYESHPDKNSRYYNVSEIKLVCDNDRTPSTFTVGYKYLYEGKRDLTVSKEKYEVVSVRNLLPMEYRNILKNEYNFPQVNSVAFSIPNHILREYGDVSEIHFDYYRYRTSPIVVTDTRNGFNAHEKRNEWVGQEVKSVNFSNPMSLVWGKVDHLGGNANDHREYGYNGYTVLTDGSNRIYWDSRYKRVSKLSYSFVAPEGVSAANHDVTSEELADWVYSYADTYLVGKEYESIPIKDGRLPAELFEDYKNEKYGYKDVYIRADTLSYKETSFDIWDRLFGIKDSVDYKTIIKVESDDVKLSESSFCEKYLINNAYCDKLKSLVSSSQLLDETVVSFRFDVSDYYVSDAQVYGTFGGVRGTFGHAYVAQTDVFLNFSFIDFTFTKDEQSTILAVSSDVIDFFPSLQHYRGSSCNGADVRKILAILLVVALIILLWKPVVVPLLSFVWKIICFPFKHLYIKNLLGDKNSRSKKSKKKGKKK